MSASALPRTRRRLLTASLATVALAGCGFQLRGSADLPFETLYAGFPPGSETGLEFERMMRGSGTRLVSRPQDAQARLDVLGENREKEIVGFSSTGRPREYQLRLLFSFRLVDMRTEDALIPPTQMMLYRDITTTDTQYVAKEQEEGLLFRDMQRDLVQQLLRRLAAAPRR